VHLEQQLVLALEDDVRVVPWDGRSPRSLTRARLALFLRREPQKDERFFVDPCQRDLFRAAIQGPPRYGGAPLLLPFDQEG